MNVLLSSWNYLLLMCVRPLHRRTLCVWHRSAVVCEVHYPPNELVKNSAVFVFRSLKKCTPEPQMLKNVEFFMKANLPETCCLKSVASQFAFIFFCCSQKWQPKKANDLTLSSWLITGAKRSAGCDSNQKSHSVNDLMRWLRFSSWLLHLITSSHSTLGLQSFMTSVIFRCG